MKPRGVFIVNSIELYEILIFGTGVDNYSPIIFLINKMGCSECSVFEGTIQHETLPKREETTCVKMTSATVLVETRKARFSKRRNATVTN